MFKQLLIWALPLFPCVIMAEEVTSLTISMTDKTTLTVPISDIRSIKFQEEAMLILQNDNNTRQIKIDEISFLTFSNVETAIQCITGNQTCAITLTDINGQIRYQGKSNSKDIPTDIRGTFILTTEGKSHKIIIR